MENRSIKAPASPLLDPDRPATAKLVWLALQANPGATPAQLKSLTGHEPLVDLLERASITYRANCPAKEARP